jgi:hypothetical protein
MSITVGLVEGTLSGKWGQIPLLGVSSNLVCETCHFGRFLPKFSAFAPGVQVWIGATGFPLGMSITVGLGEGVLRGKWGQILLLSVSSN